jgi:hypothetical protein
MKFYPVTAKAVKTYSVKERKSRVCATVLARTWTSGGRLSDFLDGLPDILAVKNLKEVSSAIVAARRNKKTVAIGMGGHVIKAGLSPIIIDLMERGAVNAVAMNGSCIVHDFELAYAGRTSEDVDASIVGGSFGMARETAGFLNGAIKDGAKSGLGRAVGKAIERSRFPNKHLSVLAAGARLGVPVTVHVAVGTDIIHMHPSMDGKATGEATLRDFRLFTGVVSALEGGVFVNIGSAVIIPEVFLKALSLARNLGRKVKNFTAVNMDFIQHYRPVTNVVRRPTLHGGRGYTLTGHHEIMLPLLYAAVVEGIGGG